MQPEVAVCRIYWDPVMFLQISTEWLLLPSTLLFHAGEQNCTEWKMPLSIPAHRELINNYRLVWVTLKQIAPKFKPRTESQITQLKEVTHKRNKHFKKISQKTLKALSKASVWFLFLAPSKAKYFPQARRLIDGDRKRAKRQIVIIGLILELLARSTKWMSTYSEHNRSVSRIIEE